MEAHKVEPKQLSKSCKLKRGIASRRIKIYLGLVKNLLWSTQVKDSGTYPEEKGYKQVSYEKALGGKFMSY